MVQDLPQRELVAREVVQIIIDGLNAGTLPLEQARTAAKETLDTLDRIEKHEESVAEFYKALSQKYPIFGKLYSKMVGEMTKAKELTAYKQALTAIHSGDVNQAHKIASSAIAQSAHEAPRIN